MRSGAAVVLAVTIAATGVVAARLVLSSARSPSGMVYFPGGSTRIGSDDGEANARPSFVTNVAPFYLDVHPVTVGEFARFATATGFRTHAEAVGSAGVFD